MLGKRLPRSRRRAGLPARTAPSALAQDHGARLVVLHVLPFELAYEGVALPMVTPADREALEEVRERVDGPDLEYPAEARLMRGDAAPSPLGAAAAGGADLIVMGTHGRTGLGRLLMGSLAEAVLRKAPCPVLAVETGTPAAAPAPPATAVAGAGG